MFFRRRRKQDAPETVSPQIEEILDVSEEEVEEPEVEPEPESIETPVVEMEAPAEVQPDAPRRRGFFGRLTAGLGKTKSALLSPLRALSGRPVDEELLEEIEEILIQADCGVETTMGLMDEVRSSAEARHVEDAADLIPIFRDAMLSRLRRHEAQWSDRPEQPFVILVVGVNGVGKTTSIGKIAKWLRGLGNSVMLVAGDTFRAAAIEQLEIWAQRTGSDFVAQAHGADPGSVCYDALVRAGSHGTDVVLIDTAGRLHTKTNLMEELKKVIRVIKKVIPDAPHETLLVLDATTGQNALQQAKIFHEAANLTGLVLTKLDGTAKGGMVLSVGDVTDVPIALIGVGEGEDDLRPFDAEEFVSALFTDGNAKG